MKINRRDIMWKGILQDYFGYFLYFFFDDANEQFDMKRPFEFLNREMAQMSEGYITCNSTFIDMLTKVYRKDSDDFMLFHVEVQDKRQPSFPERMFNYFIRLVDKYKKKVGSYAIFTALDESYIPVSYSYDFFGTRVVFTFNAFNIAAEKNVIMEQPRNPFAFILLVVLLSHQKGLMPDWELLSRKIELAEKLFKEDWPGNQKLRLLNFLRGYIYFEKDAFNHRFEESVDVLTRKNNKDMGITEGLILYYKDQEAYKMLKKLVKRKMDNSFILEVCNEGHDFDLRDIKIVRRRYNRQCIWKRTRKGRKAI